MNFPYHLPILMYHQILPRDNIHFKKHISVEPSIFKNQLLQLRSNGWTFKTLDQYWKEPSKKIIILTFDDLSSSFIEHALPILEDLNIKANLFPIQNMTENKKFYNLSSDGISGLTKDDILKLHQRGFEIGSHGQSHQNFRKISLNIASKEMKDSKDWLEQIISSKVNTICYPIGGVDRDITETARALGFKTGLSTLKGSLQFTQDRFALRRVDIKNHTTGSRLHFSVSPFYGFRRLLTRPFRTKYQVSNRHPDYEGLSNKNE